MKPVLMRHIETTTESFKAWRNGGPYLHNPWHYHPELELTVILKGRGTLFVGDKIMNYNENELFLIGSNLPHEWRSDIKREDDFYSECIAVHFIRNFPGIDFDKIIEAMPIRDLLEKSLRGIKIIDARTIRYVREKLLLLIGVKGIERINILFSILDAIAHSKKIEQLSSHSFVNSIEEGHNQKIIQVYKYLIANFKNPITVNEVASHVHMTSTSFCRFFRKRTHKSFTQYVNEIRVGYSCKLLIEKNCNINEAAYESGFENLSNFNKQFKKVKKITPTEYIALQTRK